MSDVPRCKLALAANTDRYTDRLMVVKTEHVQYPKECKDTSCTWTIRRDHKRVRTLSRDDSKN